ncbi:MAG: hypothetical protein LQ352_005931 [Teloschistes flavicans]|nr:MAG: hypothetical protein LQ352_005931 [Teloschistes flavicans]
MPLNLKLKPPSLPAQPPPEAPPSATSAKRKLTLTFGGGSQPTPPPSDIPISSPAASKIKAPRKPKADKPIRATKPTPKKREFDATALANEDNGPKGNGIATAKRIKLVAKKKSPRKDDEELHKVKHIRLKFRGKVPERPVGVGYDSCSSDIEEDPALEEEFIFRMEPGEDCEYIRRAIAERRWGPSADGGADVRMQFLRHDGRRAMISVQKRLYAACLVDLPCVIEGMKSWDKKAWFKTADICQMLLVLGRIQHESQAIEFPLPKDIDPKTWQYSHGLTPPMRFARQRRFRKRISKNAIEAVEEEIERLVRTDEECLKAGGEIRYEVTDADGLAQEERDQQAAREAAEDIAEYGDDAEGDDAEGEYEENEEDIEKNYEPIEEGEGEGDEEEIAAALAAAMEATNDLAQDTTAAADMPPPSQSQDAPVATPESIAATPVQTSFVSSPSPSAAATPAKDSAMDSGDDSATESGDDDEQSEELDEAALEAQKEQERQWAEVNDMKAMIKNQEQKAAAQPNAILKSKILTGVKALRRDLEVKLAALGVDEEGDDG